MTTHDTRPTTSSSASTSASLLSLPVLRLARTELRMGVRTGAFRFVCLVAFLIGWSAGAAPGRGVGVSAYSAGDAACQYLGLVCVIWMALAAVRDTAMRADVIVYSKPQPPERLAMARFLGAYGQTLLFLAVLFLGAAVGRVVGGGSLSGFPAYGLQYLRGAGVLFFAGAGSYCLSLLANTPVTGILIGMYWVMAISGKAFLAKFYFPWYTQNLPAYLLFGVALLCLALWFHRRKQRGSRPAALWVRLAAPVTLMLGSWTLWTTVRDGHDPQAITNRTLDMMSFQSIIEGQRTPGFLLPDQNGKLTSLSDFPDKILMIALWSPAETDSTLMLAHLNDLYLKYGSRGVLPVAICLSEDTGAVATFARGENLSFPVVADWGTHNAAMRSEMSPLASAYRTDLLPKVVITDRRRRVRLVLDGLLSYDGPELDQALQERLKEEPK